MGKINKNLTFDKNFLNELVSNENACVQVFKKTYHLALHPFHLTNLNSSIKEILTEKIAKYDKKFDGILLGYQNIKLLDRAGGINFDSCFIHTNIEADFYVFKPAVGQILNGVVNKKSKDHVGCLVHRTFNVSLPKPENCDEWIGHSTELGQDIQFEITFTNLDGKLPYIRGNILSLPSDDSGFSTSEEPNCQQNTVTKFNDSDTEVSHELVRKKTEKRKRSRSSNELDIENKKSKHDHYNDHEKFENEDSKSRKKHKHKDKKHKKIIEDDINMKNKHKHKKKVNIDEEHSYETPEASNEQNQEYLINLEKDLVTSNIHNDSTTAKRKKKKHKYSKEANEPQNNAEESLEKWHRKKKHKHGKESESEILAKNISIESESSGKQRKMKKHYSEEVLHDAEFELKTHVKKKKKRKSHE